LNQEYLLVTCKRAAYGSITNEVWRSTANKYFLQEVCPH